MKKQNRILKTLLAPTIAAVLIISSRAEETLAAVARPGIYRGKTIELQISGITSTSKRSDFSTITFYDGKRYKKPAYQYIHISNEYGSFMGFENEPCCKKGKSSMTAWSEGSGTGGGQTCWAVVTKKSASKVVLKVYWQNNMEAAMGESQPECILKETLKLVSS